MANNTISNNIPMIALRGMVVFPGTLTTFDIERKSSILSLKHAMEHDRLVFLAAQKDISVDVPGEDDISKIGVLCRVKQQIYHPNGGMCRVMVEGLFRAETLAIDISNKGMYAHISEQSDLPDRVSADKKEAQVRNCISLYEEYISSGGEVLPEQLIALLSNHDAGFLSYYIANVVPFNFQDKQTILEERRAFRRLKQISTLLSKELNIMAIEKELNDATSEAMSRSQREYYLREEMKIIQAELGEGGFQGDDIDEYRSKINALSVSDEIRNKLLKELSHLSKQPFGSSESSVIRGYLDLCLELPWGKVTKECVNITSARKRLNDDHYGLEKVKKRVLEYLAVKQLSPDIKGGLLCLVGPPGTGKTSIAMSIAAAVNRKLIRISLGGVHDEAEIRGHRKTYIGSMPGRIINGVLQAGTMNPLMVLDEIDKLGSDFRGDPSSALLEALDPEQNSTFRDHFLEMPFDLSQVFFIATANTTDTIPRALLDRMEIIEVSSYTDEEKMQIATKFLVPKQRKKHGLKASQLKLKESAVKATIISYTRESGVRQLEREIAAICRVAACKIAEGQAKSVTVDGKSIPDYLGPEKFKTDEKRLTGERGLARGLAYTAVGGEVLDVEVAVLDGSGKIEITGNLGEVMKESAKAAVSVIRSRAAQYGISPDFYKNKDIHIHFPAAAVPKDGPSAGITMSVAIFSALSGIPVRHDVAMTGEISLRGKILAIGGLNEKAMAALRNDVLNVIIPADNVPDLDEIDSLVRAKLNFIPVKDFDSALVACLAEMPVSNAKNEYILPVESLANTQLISKMGQ